MSGHARPRERFAVDVVAIDLDGTLVDTAQDLALAANRMLSLLSLPGVSEADVRGFIGQGITSLVTRCIEHASAGNQRVPEVAAARELFERMYEEGGHRRSRLYPGVIAGLDGLAAAGFRLCCITNKARRFTTSLLAGTGLAPRFELVLSGDSVTTPVRRARPGARWCAWNTATAAPAAASRSTATRR